MKLMKLLKRAGSLATVLVLSATPCQAAVDASAITPVPGSYGYFVDTYKTNEMDNQSTESNAVIGLLSSFLTLWQPGDSWNNGVFTDEAGALVLNKNIEICEELTGSRTSEQELAAYLTDRRNQNYTALDGLGPYTQAFKDLSNAATSLPAEIPADAETIKYSDQGGANGTWADTDSSLGNIVLLINTIRGPHASGNPAKIYYQYMRPFRWSSVVQIMPSLLPCVSDDPMTDGGFPSGHTNAGYLASLSLAYSIPERFQECLANASEIGNYRIVAGMHSPVDVIGGRIMATALAAASLNDPENADLKAAAHSEAINVLLTSNVSADDDPYADHDQYKQLYEQRLTYGLPQTGDTTKPMVVPKGAEVLLETRFPYLSATQRRWVLYSTGLPSGYALLDDAEGWGRLNLYAAGDGYGAFDRDVSVTMESSEGGFSAYDEWRNDISGEGCLTKNGDGILVLSGNNSYTGGINVNGGTLIAASARAFGYGSVNNSAVLTETTDGPVVIWGSFTQSRQGTLSLDINSPEDMLQIDLEAKLDGTLKLDFNNYPNPDAGMQVLTAERLEGSFSTIEVIGLADGLDIAVTDTGIVVVTK
ncbi:MAG: phosphatase PAP2 family protein [Lachnospiraceae bacterium]